MGRFTSGATSCDLQRRIMPTLTPFADAELLARGIRLGAAPDRVALLDTALRGAAGPLTADDVERYMHSDWDRWQLAATQVNPRSDHVEPVGMARLHAPHPDHPEVGWALAATWYGWLPGIYTTREAALLAYGYLLGGESAGFLEELRDQVLRGESRHITVDDIEGFAAERGRVA